MRVRVIQPKVKEKVKKKVCAYARVSTLSNSQGESLENQITYYERLIQGNPQYEFVGVFADRGITGTRDNRPDFQRMLDMARNGEIDLIITKSITRFARNTALMLETVRELKSMGVEVEFQKENIKTLSGDGEFMLTILSSFAEEESRSISENTKWAIRRKFKKGEAIINTERFLGYNKDEYGDLIINQKEAQIVERIYDEYLNGKGIFTIAKGLNKDRIPTVTGTKWHESTVKVILTNEKYKGDAHLQKYYTPNHLKGQTVKNEGELDSYYIRGNHPLIIPEDKWDKVQNIMESRAKEKGNIKGDRDKYKNRYSLSSMLFCSKCGYSLIRRTWNSKNTSRKIVWQCSNYINNGKISCPGTKIDDEIINKVNIEEETIVKEVKINGKTDYIYTSKNGEYKSSREPRAKEKENGSLLQSVNRPIRTTIQL